MSAIRPGHKYGFERLEVGDALLVPFRRHADARNAQLAAHVWGGKHGRKFQTRKVIDHGAVEIVRLT